jgi:hypothetical protein
MEGVTEPVFAGGTEVRVGAQVVVERDSEIGEERLLAVTEEVMER